jgi:2-oxo-4-hydroxy-4-carboxy-5-ureidoimidazoline decarboxylase
VAADPDHPLRSRLALLFEGAPRFVDRLAAEQTASLDELLDRAESVALAMPEDEQVDLLDAHPRIGAAPGSVSALSYREQGYDREPATAQLQARLDRLNAEYEQRFGFRFVVHVAGRSRAEIAEILASRLGASREEERQRGLSNVIAIARDRAARLELEEAAR